MPNSPIDDLFASIKRAETTGKTDEDQVKFDAMKRISNEVQDILVRESKTGTLSNEELLKCLATILGLSIRVNTADNVLAKLVVAMQISELVLNTALGGE